MRNLVLAAGLAATTSLAGFAVHAQTVGVSWSNFQEERWKTDEAAMKAAIEAAGGKYISADAQASATKQLTDVEALIAQGGLYARYWKRQSGGFMVIDEGAEGEGAPAAAE